MADVKRVKESDLSPSIYELPKKFYLKSILGFILVFGLSFFLAFSIKDIIEGKVREALASLGPCSVGYTDVVIEYLPPRALIKDPSLPANCFGSGGKVVYLSDLVLTLSGVSIVPFGPKFHLSTRIKDSSFHIYPTLGLNTQVINVEDTIIDLGTLPPITDALSKVTGKIDVRTLITLEKGKFKEAKILLKSSDFRLMPNAIPFVSEPMNLNELGLKAVYGDKNILTIDSLVLGDDQAPLRADLSGTVAVVPFRPTSSTLNLKGELKIAKEATYLQFVDTLLQSRSVPVEEGFYQLSIQGPLEFPQVGPK